MTGPRTGIVDYGIGNLRSVANAVAAAGAEPRLVTDPAELAGLDRLLLPGVGAFAPGIAALRASGMVGALERAVAGGTPLLGICLGMQLLARRSFEDGETEGLGWIDADVLPLASAPDRPVPHMGWNALLAHGSPALLAGVAEGADVYFLHSYYVACDDPADVLASCDYGVRFAAVIGRGGVSGMQFHPEKSQETGLRLLRNFLSGSS